jgi:DNA-binding NtrC family response regulator/tetratricopeptide (TPR) repeat protein
MSPQGASVDRRETARQLVIQGRFIEALTVVGDADACHDTAEGQLLRAELLERVGRHRESAVISKRLLATKTVSPAFMSSAELTLGLIALGAGDTADAIARFQRAITHAAAAKDLYRHCWGQLRLMAVLAGRASGAASSVDELSQVRANVTRLGDPHTTAALHILLGEVETKRGLIHSATRHTDLGLQILGSATDLWLRAFAENTRVAIAIMHCDIRQGIARAERGLDMAEESGAAAMIRALVGNLGNLYCLSGDFDRAAEFFKRSVKLVPCTGEYSNCGIDGLARLALLRGDHSAAAACLAQIEASIRCDTDWALYPNRYAQLTATEMLMQQRRWKKAKNKIDEVLELSTATQDRVLFALATSRKIEILSRCHESRSAEMQATQLARSLHVLPPEITAHYERALACLLREHGLKAAAQAHLNRASSIFVSLHSMPGCLECKNIQREFDDNESVDSETQDANLHEEAQAATSLAGCIVQDVASLLLHVGHPELVGRETIGILGRLGVVSGAVLTAHGNGGSREVLAAIGQVLVGNSAQSVHLGFSGGGAIELRWEPSPNLEAHATLNAVHLLLSTIGNLERAHAEQAERHALWPLEELPADDEDAVVLGKMRDLMAVARKVARINIAVLITGESGTGKEVLARAIHRSSTRADKPFVPVNCTAVPRDLLESQLFGHRRGAFTGAERDSLGMIRTARGGTLFLDEIGELSLDVQPKLLRFLESGEVAPLGEPTPQRVDVRVIAATNADLEGLVQAGRFRQDLFYRLNVIPLSIPPLRERRDEIPALVHHQVAKAAAEFGKGRVRVSEDAMEHLILYHWPGNVRELHNELRRIVALADPDTVLVPEVLSPQIVRATPPVRSTNGHEIAVPLNHKLNAAVTEVEREMIKTALRTHNGRLEAAARALGISRKGLYLKRQRLGL